jgi:hypothetical protein
VESTLVEGVGQDFGCPSFFESILRLHGDLVVPLGSKVIFKNRSSFTTGWSSSLISRSNHKVRVR